VAARKRDVPADWSDPLADLLEGLDPENPNDVAAPVARYNEFHKSLDGLPCIELNAPSAGKSFSESSLEGFRDRLVALRNEGIRFPAGVIEEIEEEIAEREKQMAKGTLN